MATPSLRVKGLPGVQATLERFGDKMHDSVRAIVRDGAHDIRNTAFDMAPIKTGDLEASIVVEEKRGDRNRIVYVVKIDESKFQNAHEADYYVKVHEGIGKNGAAQDYGKTEAGIRKSIQTGEIVGPKYLQRAMNRHEKRLKSLVQAELARLARRTKRS